MALKRPLPCRSFRTTPATSSPPSPGTERLKGTMAMGIGSVTPEVISIFSCACAAGTKAIAITTAAARARRDFSFTLKLMASIHRNETNLEVALEERGVGGRRQWRGAINRGLDRVAH